ncbi:MAG: polyamine aminopropyltransferase [Gammaproteobacteria bacterium]|nr:polyamine aminopropyltransferase [Gammaproteobacteria bacterium]
MDSSENLTNKQLVILLFSILIVALCGITYELIIGAVSSYLLGNSVYQFSLTIGFFMFAMGIGSFLSKLFMKQLLGNFILIEIAISLAGGFSSLILFMAFPLANPLYTSVMYTLIMVIGILVGLEIPLLTRIISRRESISDSIANVLSLDYIGALIGSLIFPLFLLPQLGLIRSSFAIGLINVLTAIINVYFFRASIKHPRLLGFISVLTLVLLIILTILGARLNSFAEQHLYFDQIIYKKQTPYQRMVFTRAQNNKDHRLFIDGHIQFSERDEYRYHEMLVHPLMSVPGPRGNVLILGGGDGLAAREILKYSEVKRIHLVDIDPEIVRFSSTFPVMVKLNGGSLEHPKVKVFNTDAFSFINQAGPGYDRVIIDLPDPHNEALNKLYSREFYTMIKRRMNTGGLLATQSSSPFIARNTYWCIEHTLRAARFSTYSYHTAIPAFGIWGFHIGALTETAPDSFDIKAPTRYLNNEVIRAAGVFGKDIAPLNTPVNTIMEPKLYMLYLKDLMG